LRQCASKGSRLWRDAAIPKNAGVSRT
jgi:hypothetical protein